MHLTILKRTIAKPKTQLSVFNLFGVFCFCGDTLSIQKIIISTESIRDSCSFEKQKQAKNVKSENNLMRNKRKILLWLPGVDGINYR